MEIEEISSTDSINKKGLQDLICKNDQSIELIPVERKKEWWKHFKFIRLNNKKLDNFFFCSNCKKVFSFNLNSSKANSTHINTCLSKKNDSQMNSQPISKMMKNILPMRIAKQIDQKTAFASAIDLKPFSFARGEGYLQLVQHIIDITSIHGRFDIEDYSPHTTTVTKNLEELTDEITKVMKQNFDKINHGCAILDHWSSRMNKTKYIGIAYR